MPSQHLSETSCLHTVYLKIKHLDECTVCFTSKRLKMPRVKKRKNMKERTWKQFEVNQCRLSSYLLQMICGILLLQILSKKILCELSSPQNQSAQYLHLYAKEYKHKHSQTRTHTKQSMKCTHNARSRVIASASSFILFLFMFRLPQTLCRHKSNRIGASICKHSKCIFTLRASSIYYRYKQI